MKVSRILDISNPSLPFDFSSQNSLPSLSREGNEFLSYEKRKGWVHKTLNNEKYTDKMAATFDICSTCF